MAVGGGDTTHLAALSAPPSEVGRLVELIRDRRGFDFSSYKHASLSRSITRRAAACRCLSLEQYRTMVEQSDAELDALLSEITVGYSAFFRDPELFDLLRRRVLPEIVARRERDTSPRIRIWSAACAGGEEAYSIAILLYEALEGRLDRFDVRLFATDVDRASLAKARAGRYTKEELGELAPELIARYFTGKYTFTVQEFLRRFVRFGEHNVFTDPPISRLDLICCRNVLIYLKKDAQVRTLRYLWYGLVPGGVLVLGKAEKLCAELEPAFEPVSAKWRVYRKIEGPPR